MGIKRQRYVLTILYTTGNFQVFEFSNEKEAKRLQADEKTRNDYEDSILIDTLI